MQEEIKASEDEMQRRNELAFTIPPDWKICMYHRKAQYIYFIPRGHTASEYTACPCCGEPYTAPRIKFCDDSRKMAEHGFGLTLYFIFELYLGKLFAVLLIPAILTILAFFISGWKYGNRIADDYVLETQKVGDFYSWWSFALCNKSSFGPIMMVSCIFYSVCYYITCRFVSMWTRSESVSLNNNNLDPTDYSIMLRGLPTKPDFDENNFLIELYKMLKIEKSDVAREVFTNDISFFSKKLKELNNLIKIRTLIDNFRKVYKQKNNSTDESCKNIYPKSVQGCGKPFKDYDDLLLKIANLDNEVEAMQNDPDKKLADTPIAFITFHSSKLKTKILKAHKSKTFGRRKIKFVDTDKRKYKISIEEAEYPDDILWENLQCTTQKLRAVLTWFITAAIIAASFLGNYYLKKNGEVYAEKLAGSQDKTNIKVKIFTLGSSIIVAVINVIVIIVIPKLTLLEKHITKTDYHTSASFKLAIAQFINTALIPLVLNWNPHSYFASNGLVDQAVFNWIFLVFLTPIIEIFDVSNILSHLFMCIAKCKGNKSELTQSEANAKFIPPYQVMCIKYSNLLLYVYYTMFYLQLWPPGVVMFLLGLGFNYISDKILTKCRYSRDEIPSESIAIYTVDSLVGGLIMIVAANFIFIYKVETLMLNKLVYGLVPIGLLIILIIISEFACINVESKKGGSKMKNCIAKMCNRDHDAFIDLYEDVPYDLSKFGDEDYMAFNPITRKKALLEQIDSQMKITQEDNNKKELEMAKAQINGVSNKINLHPSKLKKGQNIGIDMTKLDKHFLVSKIHHKKNKKSTDKEPLVEDEKHHKHHK